MKKQYDPLPVEKSDHPDVAGGIVWADCELDWIRAYGTRCYNHGNAKGMEAGKLLFDPKVGNGETALEVHGTVFFKDNHQYRSQLRFPIADGAYELVKIENPDSAVNNAWIAWQARASLAASAGSEPVAWTTGLNWRTDTRCQSEMVVKLTRKSQPEYGFTQPLYTHPSPPEGMVGGWRPMADAPRDGTLILAAIYIHSSDGTAEWQRHAIYFDDERDCTYFDGGDDTGWEFDDYEFWTPLPPPPTTPAGSGKGA